MEGPSDIKYLKGTDHVISRLTVLTYVILQSDHWQLLFSAWDTQVIFMAAQQDRGKPQTCPSISPMTQAFIGFRHLLSTELTSPPSSLILLPHHQWEREQGRRKQQGWGQKRRAVEEKGEIIVKGGLNLICNTEVFIRRMCSCILKAFVKWNFMIRAKSTDFLILQKRKLGLREVSKCSQKLYKKIYNCARFRDGKQEAK